MVQITIPVQKDKLNEKNEIIKGEAELITLQVDTSFASHARWQKYFQDEFNGDNLSVYIAKASIWLKDKNTAMSHFLDILKVMYCFIKSAELPDFNSFLEMLDNNTAPIVLEKMTVILNEAGSPATKN
jgi:hypothetical protein